jgi:HAE1 family hydrophobic/amphiphilic exporter-1
MTISDFAIRRPVITVVTMLALVVFGLVSLTQLQTDEFPDVAVPVVVVSVPYPGASPDSVEREIIDPLEEAFTAISGVKRVKSNALDSFGVVMVEFQYEKDLQEATQDIRDKINSIRNDLPE